MSQSKSLNIKPLYQAQQVKAGEVEAAKLAGLGMYQLMLSAGEAVFNKIIELYGGDVRVLVLCGGGNNGGDGYVVAKLAVERGIKVTVWAATLPDKLTGDAKRAYQDYLLAGGQILQCYSCPLDNFDVAIDALLGTGLSGKVRDELGVLIDQVNDSHIETISVDVPSGLCSDTGRVLGHSIRANHTVTFIGIKRGLVTGQARAFVGHLHFSGLGVNEQFEQMQTTKIWLDSPQLIHPLKQRDACAHKGTQGKALLVGGEYGLGGAILIAANACLKSGSGLTACLTEERNLTAGLVSTPEVMFATWSEGNLSQRLDWCNAFALGPGLGKTIHAQQIFERASNSAKPKVFDADALSFLAENPNKDDRRVITPHPGEAAKLLACSIDDIEKNRYQAVVQLQQRYGGVVVLKGAGTLVCTEKGTYVCSAGNAGMATGGMGDTLTGITVALLAQSYTPDMAARIAVMLHSCAADYNVSSNGQCGLTATDVVNSIRDVIHHI